MNIKEHIEAGHYPKDEKGRALVPMHNGGMAVICATDKPGFSLVGWRCDKSDHSIYVWTQSGQPTGNGSDLLPPSPRKVVVKAWAIVGTGGRIEHFQGTQFEAEQFAGNWRLNGISPKARAVELTGEYEESWS